MTFSPRKSSVFTQGLSTASKGGYNRGINQYQPTSSGIRRHEYELAAPNIGTSTLLPNEYFGVTLAHFARSFGAGVDDEPTATFGNNFQTAEVMNGSRIGNMRSTITLKNQGATNPATLTIYEVSTSFWDAHIYDTVDPTQCPVSMNVGAAALQGDVAWKPMNTTRMQDNTIKNSKFRQRYVKPMGTVTLGNTDNASSTAVFNINRIPPQCRKSQYGMFFGYIFVNDTAKNAGGTTTFEYSLENAFDEFPSSNRLPWLA